MRNITCLVFTIVLCLMYSSIAAVPELISFQGRLTDAGGVVVADGGYVTIFTIYDAAVAGNSKWTEEQKITTVDGLFSVLLGADTPIPDSVFNTAVRYLGIKLESDPELTPRTRLVTVPYSYQTVHADTADYALTGAGGGGSVWTQTGNVIHLIDPDDTVGIGTSTPTTKLDINGQVRIEGKLSIGPGCINTGWFSLVSGANNSALGNYSVIPGGNFNLTNATYTVVGGGLSNAAMGFNSTVCGGQDDSALAYFSFVGGGFNNVAGDSAATVVGGRRNRASGLRSFVGGGFVNNANGRYSTIGGGYVNVAEGHVSVVCGGANDSAIGDWSFVGSGFENKAVGAASVVTGGYYNRAEGDFSAVGGGGGYTESDKNVAIGLAATISGGQRNLTEGAHSVIGGGRANYAFDSAMVGGGVLNWAGGNQSTISGGLSNQATGQLSTVGGGGSNQASDLLATVGGGGSNLATGIQSTISGGAGNQANGSRSVISGGILNLANGSYAVVSGGSENTASGPYSTVSGGNLNQATGEHANVSGGWGNEATGTSAAIPGGEFNTASAYVSLAAGRLAQAIHNGSFVWSDATTGGFASTSVNQFLIEAAGGVGINTNAPEVPLHVEGGGDVSTGGGGYFMIGPVTGSNLAMDNNEIMARNNGAVAPLYLNNNGGNVLINGSSASLVGIGNNSPTRILHVKQNSTTDPIADAWTTYSSRRWKKEIRPIENPLDLVSKLTGVRYKWKADDRDDIGLIAEEVGQVIPEIVVYEENGIDAQSVDYARIVAVLIEGMKEQQQQINSQQQQIDELKELVNKHANKSSGKTDTQFSQK